MLKIKGKIMCREKHLWITIDTEMDADIHWVKKWPPQFSSIIEGIPNFYRPLWDEYHVHPIYFVSPEVLYFDENCRILKEEIEKGAFIGAHLHPEYITPNSRWGAGIEKITPQFPNSACTTSEEYEKIHNLTHLIEDKLGYRPLWYRGARFGADLDTAKSLERLGYQFDSSVTPGIDWSSKGGPNHKEGRLETYQINENNFYSEGILEISEIPITVCGKRWGFIGKFLPDYWIFYRWLRPTCMTYLEMKRLVDELEEYDNLVMMFHSMEVMINKTPYVRSRFMQKYFLLRLEKIIQYVKKKGYML